MIKFVIPLLAALFILLPVAITQTVYADPRDPIFCCVDPPEPPVPNDCCDPVDPPGPPEVVEEPPNDNEGNGDPPIVIVTPPPVPPVVTPTPVVTPRPAIGICHATGNASNPYVHILVEHKDRPQHDRHGQDIVGISNPNDCPKPIVVVEPPIIDPPVVTPPVVVTEPPVVVVELPAVTAPAPVPGIAIPPAQNAPTSVEKTVTVPVASVAIPDKVQAPQAATMPRVLPRAGGSMDGLYFATVGIVLGILSFTTSLVLWRRRS